MSEQVFLSEGHLQTEAGDAVVVSVGSGGATNGVRWYRFDFAWDTPGLKDGILVYTPTGSEVLVDVMVVMDTAFDGITYADIGDATPGSYGIFSSFLGSQIDIDNADYVLGPDTTPTSYTSATSFATRLIPTGYGQMFLTGPIYLWANYTGLAGGTVSPATAGSGSIYLAVASPEAL